jgi:hypothetical protein
MSIKIICKCFLVSNFSFCSSLVPRVSRGLGHSGHTTTQVVVSVTVPDFRVRTKIGGGTATVIYSIIRLSKEKKKEELVVTKKKVY